MNKKVVMRTGIGIIVGSLVAGGTFIFANQTFTQKENVFSKEKLSFINYVVGGNFLAETNSSDMMEGIYKGYVYGLGDSYTTYLTKEEFRKQKIESTGDYIGTGIRFSWGITNQYLIVTEVIPGSPAEEAGIKIGDKITEIDGIKAMMSNETQIYEKLTFTGNTPVKYTIEDNDGMNKRTIELISRVVSIELIETDILDNRVGYIKIEGLREGTTDELKNRVDELKAKGATQFVIDLRGTYSDNLEEVKGLCDLFLTDGIAFTISHKNNEKVDFSTNKEYFEEELVVITNGYTSGAIEAFVGAVKELGRGKVVGEKTAGNGTIQELVELEDESGIRITTGFILDPKGQQIKDNGIVPDISERTPTANRIELVTTGKVERENDVQLQKAIQALD